VERRLQNAENYWVATSRPDGRPHAMPVYGLWLDSSFWFATGRHSVKGRNIAANPAVVVHLESGDDVVIVEGTAGEVPDPARAAEVVPQLAGKYGMGPEEMAVGDPASGAALYVVRPRVVQAWLEGALPETHSRWQLS
jgi:nitroimidazol reductase NimA-like FMN-containing flavoprotein (pyridoxamine 5'-phosphate oxidase superfamily)